MAAGGPVQELREEATCSICLDFFRDPVAIAECGHSFCRACLTRSWGEAAGAEASCPQCRGRAQPKGLRPNLQLANFVEIVKKFSLREGREAGAKGGVCELHQEPLRFFCEEDQAPLCVVCRVSREHKGHKVIPLEEAAREKKAVVAARKGRVCQKHQEPLKLFCKDDEALICVVCDRSKEHRDHKTLPLEEASQEYKEGNPNGGRWWGRAMGSHRGAVDKEQWKDHFCSCLEILKKERERIVVCKEDVMKESEDLLKQTTGEKQKTVAKFRQLYTFLEEQEKLLLAEMEEVEKEVERRKDQHLDELSEALSSLESLIQEMEEKCEQPAGDLLQDVRSMLKRYEEKEVFETPVTSPLALKWGIWNFYDINHLLEGVMKQLKENLNSGLHLQKATVTLDPDTAHSELILSEDRKSVRIGGKAQALPYSPERFEKYACVLGLEGFITGRHFWEVFIGSEGVWAVGVARKSVRRKGNITFCPEAGFWEVGKWGNCYHSCDEDCSPLTPSGELKRIRVCLNCPGGRVTFFDADTAALIYEFSGASFSGETLLPSFWVDDGHLQLS